MSTQQAIQIFSISTALIASGGIASFSLFNVPLLKSQPASRSLPSIRWLFSRGSHIFPQAAIMAGSGFAYLAYDALPPGTILMSNLLHHVTRGKPALYLAAAFLSIAIAPTTSFMIPTNFELISMNEQKHGTKSADSAAFREARRLPPRTAEESTQNKDDIGEFTDLSGPQGKTPADSTPADDEKVGRLLDTFARLNWIRAVLLAAGGVVGLAGALA
ncbi:hypothetical protein ACN47E_009944 [Coniothyrium glycines]